MDAVTCALSRSDIHDLLSNACTSLKDPAMVSEESGAIAERPNKRLVKATTTAASVLFLQAGEAETMDVDVASNSRAAKRCIPFCKESKASKAADSDRRAKMASARMYGHDRNERYAQWKSRFDDDLTAKQ